MTDSKPNKYNHSKLYKLQCEDGYYYIGCTTNSLPKRLGSHKIDSKRHSERNVYSHINSIGWDRVRIVLISEHNLENREQLLRAETELITKYKDDPCCLNINRSKITDEERKERDSKNKKEYYENNKEIILDKQKEYRDNNKEIILDKYKEYRENNKDKIKEYYKNNKDKFLEKIECICGSNYTHMHKLRHERSKKHINFINSHVGNSNFESNDTSSDDASSSSSV